jgi:outer membrane protein assembly factor BamA
MEGGTDSSNRSIEIKGNQKVETSTIQFYIRNRVGDDSPSRIREDILRIYRLGFFKDVQVDVEESSRAPQGHLYRCGRASCP